MSGRRVVSGMCASSGCWTIGASTPSTSSRTAERSGSSLSGRSSSSSISAVEGGTAPSMARDAQGPPARRGGDPGGGGFRGGCGARGTRPLVCPAMRRTLQLAGVGTVAGLFSGLFGVGGGVVIVPLLALAMDFPTRVAAATSLAAIAVVAAAAGGLQAVYGNADVGEAALVGLPAVVGVVAGTALQQRLATRTLRLAFAALLVVVAATLIF